ncbi:L,D-transpeptidase family protein [Patescibacteria group bacterium]|nr:L,D-transpeptidase family protein [Patescibacteria group bacterium]
MKKISILLFLFFASFFLLTSNALAEQSHDPLVKVFNANSHREDTHFKAYTESFKGGVNVAIGDVNGNGKNEIITGAGPTGSPEVRIYDSSGNFTGKSFIAFHPDFRGGVKVAAGDTDNDGRDEIIVSQESKGEPWVKVYDCDKQCSVKSTFLAFGRNFKGGVSVAAGDTDANGKAEIIVGAGMGGGPQVRLLDEFGNFVGFSTFAFSEQFRGGVNVASGDLTGDGKEDIIVSQGNMGQAWIKAYDGTDKRVIGNFMAFIPQHKGGAYVASSDIDNDGKEEIIASVGDQGGPQIMVYRHDGHIEDYGFFAYDKSFRGGVTVAAGGLDNTQKIVTGPGHSVVEGRTDLHKYIEINLSTAHIYAYEDGIKVVESLISAGRPGMRTPTGTFRVRRKEVNHWSGSYGLWMPYSLNFTGSYYIHKLPVWPSGYVEGESHLGLNVSHGCVRVSNEAAPKLFEFADIGTPIFIHY